MTSLTQLNLQSTKFEQIKNRLNYQRLIADLDLELNEYRGEWWCPCPLPYGNHARGDRNASFSINLENPNKIGLYNCFVCGGGNIIMLVSILKNIPYDEAEEFVSQYFTGTEENFEADLEHVLDSKDKTEYDTPMPELSEETLFQYRFVHPWMTEQGLTLPAIKHFQIGYDEDRGAVVFPHYHQGKLVGMQFRDLTGEKKAKYINTPDFPKRSTIFHMDCECIHPENDVIVVESPKTVVKLWGLGFRCVVATFGAEMNPEQMASLWAFEGKVYLWFDNDPAGAKAYRTATKYLRGMVDVYLVPPVELDKGDPADLTSSDEVYEYLERSKSLLEMEL